MNDRVVKAINNISKWIEPKVINPVELDLLVKKINVFFIK